eukprot:13586328-Ditylum_brightwellii.AAC.1
MQTIGTALSHPAQGATQLFHCNCTAKGLVKIFENSRAHTGKGYKNRKMALPPTTPALKQTK